MLCPSLSCSPPMRHNSTCTINTGQMVRVHIKSMPRMEWWGGREAQITPRGPPQRHCHWCMVQFDRLEQVTSSKCIHCDWNVFTGFLRVLFCNTGENPLFYVTLALCSGDISMRKGRREASTGFHRFSRWREDWHLQEVTLCLFWRISWDEGLWSRCINYRKGGWNVCVLINTLILTFFI